MARKDLQRVNTCKNLLQKYTLDELSFMISQGTFDDIYVGDYIDMKMTTNLGTEEEPNNVTETVRWLVGHIKYFQNIDNHILLVAESSLKSRGTFGASDDFRETNMFSNLIPKYDIAVETAFGSSHILTWNCPIQTAKTSGLSMVGAGRYYASSSNVNRTAKLDLLNEVQLLGYRNFSSSYYDVLQKSKQIAIFKEKPTIIETGVGYRNSIENLYSYWLSSYCFVSSQTAINPGGKCDNYGPTQILGIRPYFLFK